MKEDTEGCILLGFLASVENEPVIGKSRDAYRCVYPLVREAVESGYRVTIEVTR